MKKTLATALGIGVTVALAALLAGCTGPSNESSGSTASASSPSFSSSPSSASQQTASGSEQTTTEWTTVEDGKLESPLAQQLAQDINPIIKKSGMGMGVCVIDLESGERFESGGDKRMISASMIKLAIAASFLEAIEAGDFSLDDTYVVEYEDIVGGTGSLGEQGAGAEVTYSELLEMMIAESDNTATNILINAVGKKAVNATAQHLGLAQTKLNRLMMDEDAIAEGTENYVSARDVATILELAYQHKLVSEKASKHLLSALSKQIDDTGILAGLPKRAKFAHKTGSLASVQHDGGIVTGEDGHNYAVVVLCGGKGFTLDGALDAMEDIGRVTYRDLVTKRQG